MFKKKENNSEKEWKRKAVERQREIKRLKKKIKEIIKSRDHWKDKAKKIKEINKKIEEELKKNE